MRARALGGLRRRPSAPHCTALHCLVAGSRRPGCRVARAADASHRTARARRLLARAKSLRSSKLATEKAAQRAFVAAEGFVSATDVAAVQTAVNALSKLGSLLAADNLEEAKTIARQAHTRECIRAGVRAQGLRVRIPPA